MKKLFQIMLAIVAIVTMAMFACSCSPSSITSALNDYTGKLQTPEGIYLDEDNVLRWNSVPNAASYIVTIEEKDYERSTVACDLKKILKTNGTYEVFVKAKSDKINISDSDYSEGVTIKFTGAKADEGDKQTETKLFGEFEDLFTKEAYIGYGYDVINSSYVNSREVKMNYPIFDMNKLKNQRLLKINERDSQDEYISGNSLDSYQAEFEAKLKTKLKVSKAFSASLAAKYKATTSSTASALFYEYRHSTVCYSLVLQCDFEEYKNMLTDSFKRDLMNLDLPTLFSRYGTHLITSTIMGGRFDLNYTMLSNENIDTSKLSTDLDTTLKAWCVDTSVNASVDIEEKAKQNKCDISTYSKVYGGDYVAMQNEKAILSNYQKWLSTVEDKPALIGIRDINSLVPVWELLGDSDDEQKRKSEMYDYFIKYGKETYDSILESRGINKPIYPTGLIITVKDENRKLLENNTTHTGAKLYLDYKVEPENAPITKSVTFSDPDYIIYNSSDNSVLIKDNVPNNTTLYITVDIGSGIRQTVAVKILQTYKVSFRANGGVTASGNQLSPVAVKHGDTVKAPEKINKEGYLFDGWYTDENCTNEFVFGEIPITEDTVLYAKWRGKVKVTFNSMGGTDIPSISVYEGELINSEIKNPKKTGAEFVGWFTSPDCSADSRFYIETTRIESDITLYAGWASDVYTVKFDSKGGKEVADINIEHGQAIGILPLIERIGYSFVGWFTSEDYASEATAETPVIDNMTLYAKWRANSYVISFEGIDDSSFNMEGESIKIIEYGDVYGDLPICNMTGYIFLGWYTSGDDEIRIDESSIMHTANDHILYPRFEAITYTIMYDPNGGQGETKNSSHTYDIDGYLTTNCFSRLAYTFIGWNTQADGKGISYTNEAHVKNLLSLPNGLLVLYAQWSANIISYDVITLRTGNQKINGSGHYTEDNFSLSDSIKNYINKGYKKIKIQLKVDLKEVDNCYQYFKLYNNGVMVQSVTKSHGGSTKNTSWGSHDWDIVLSLSELGSNSFTFRCQAENALFKDFYIGTVTAQITVYPD